MKEDEPTENQPAEDGKKPNIVFILFDNLGYGEVGWLVDSAFSK